MLFEIGIGKVKIFKIGKNRFKVNRSIPNCKTATVLNPPRSFCKTVRLF